ncbi:MAG: adenosylcobalamin-dependent ribonucleoside-diphosphate reductase, partial [Telluria sp.]
MNADHKIMMAMPPQEISLDVLREKYAKGDEREIDDVRRRVSAALANHEPAHVRETWEREFLWAQQSGFVAGGRINSAAGIDTRATLINCFVQPIGDSVTSDADGVPSIYKALSESAETMRRGGGVGYDFSPIRPAGSKVNGTQSRACGPMPYIELFNSSCKTVESAGARRGAQMGVLRVDHPDIEAFIAAKDGGDLTHFNLSIGVSDAFMQAVADGLPFDLIHIAEPADEAIAGGAQRRDDGMWAYRKADARTLWDKVMRSTYDHAEPGVLFVDQINRENNLWYAEQLNATNPCGEQPLPPYGCCDLGSLNLTAYVKHPFTDRAGFDFQRMRQVATIAVRMLDLVLDATVWPLEKQALEAQSKRRIGLGFLGLGSALVMLGLRYDSDEGRSIAARIMCELRDVPYTASVELAKEKGPFPLFDSERYLKGEFIKRLPAVLRDGIEAHGIRNSHLLSIAPTGTITLAFADNASNGIEPAFSWEYNRKKRMADGTTKTYEVADHAWRLFRFLGHDVAGDASLPSAFVTALQMPAIDHLRMMEVMQPFVDTAISKTVNVPVDYPYENFKDLYFAAWRAGLKGLATYRPNQVLGSVLSVDGQGKTSPALVNDDPLHKRFDRRPRGDLESVTSKIEYSTQEGIKSLYLSMSFIPADGVIDGKPETIERPFEFFMPAGQRSEGQQWIAASMRLLSLAARAGGSIAKALADLRQVMWEKGPVRCGFFTKDDGTQVPLYHDSEVAAIAYTLQLMLMRRGFLDASANQVPAVVLARRFVARNLHVTSDY